MGAKSKGCTTCKLRRVRCDETHPFCRRFQKAGWECEGNRVIPRFIDEASRMGRKLAVKSNQEADHLSKIHYKPCTAKQPASFPVQPSLHLNGFLDDILIKYLESKIASGWPGFSSEIESWRIEGTK